MKTSWMKTLRMRTTIMIPPAHLDRSWRTFISTKLRQSFLHSCIPHCGFITSITDEEEDTIHCPTANKNELVITSTSGEVKYTVEFSVQALIPRPGVCMEARTELLTPHGILLQHPYMSIFLPTRYLKKQGYEMKNTFSASSVFTSRTSTLLPTISTGMKIAVVLVHVRFENYRFFALARIAT